MPYPTRGNYVTRPSLCNTDQRLITLYYANQILNYFTSAAFVFLRDDLRRGGEDPRPEIGLERLKENTRSADQSGTRAPVTSYNYEQRAI